MTTFNHGDAPPQFGMQPTREDSHELPWRHAARRGPSGRCSEATLEIAVRDTVVRPDDPLHFVLTAAPAVAALAGELRIEKANAEMDGSFTPLGSPRAILYQGVVAERLALVTTAPEYPGVYRLVFATNNGIVGSDEFFVQDDGA
jgi:hypothetical protein